MNKFINCFKVFAVILCTAFAKPSLAYEIEVDGIGYTITSFTNLTVNASAVINSEAEEVTFPSTVTYGPRTLNVTKISDGILKNNLHLKKVTISEGIDTLGANLYLDTCH